MMTSGNTMHAVKKILSVVGVLKGCKNTKIGATGSIVLLLGSVDTYVEVSTAPLSRPIDFITVARMCAIII
jgi:hypothetical protein